MKKIKELVFTSLPDGMTLPLRIWLVMVNGDMNQVLPCFDEEQAKEIHRKLSSGGRERGVTLVGPYVLE